jgi:hypothetical protein
VIRLDIRRVTLHGYDSGQRDHFAQAIAAQISAQMAGSGAPPEAARSAAEAILTAVDGRLAQRPAPQGRPARQGQSGAQPGGSRA